MRIVTIAGPGMHRGLEYGQALTGDIASAATALKTHLASSGQPPSSLGRHLLGGPLARAAAEWTPDLWAEVTSLATTSRVPLEDILMLTFLDEVWALTRRKGATGCSAVARTIDPRPGVPPLPGTTEIGQTMDLPAWTSGRVVILRIGSPQTPNALVMTYPGSIGLCGANEAGLGVAVNALSWIPLDEEGLGVAFITRHLLTLSTLAEAEAFLTTVPHAAGQAYTIAAPDGIATFEAGSTGVRRVSDAGSPAIVHTNHSLARGAMPEGPSPSESSRERYDLVVRGLASHQPFADILTGDLVLDGRRWGDAHLTFAAFRAVGTEPVARFIDGADVRNGRHEWSRFAFR